LLALILFGIGFALEFLWVIAAVILALWLIGSSPPGGRPLVPQVKHGGTHGPPREPPSFAYIGVSYGCEPPPG
jgi:hypothetical protein